MSGCSSERGPLRTQAIYQPQQEAKAGGLRAAGGVAAILTDEQLGKAVALAMLPSGELRPSWVRISAHAGGVVLEGELESEERRASDPGCCLGAWRGVSRELAAKPPPRCTG